MILYTQPHIQTLKNTVDASNNYKIIVRHDRLCIYLHLLQLVRRKSKKSLPSSVAASTVFNDTLSVPFPRHIFTNISKNKEY